jgi:hypothetical protein
MTFLKEGHVPSDNEIECLNYANKSGCEDTHFPRIIEVNDKGTLYNLSDGWNGADMWDEFKLGDGLCFEITRPIALTIREMSIIGLTNNDFQIRNFMFPEGYKRRITTVLDFTEGRKGPVRAEKLAACVNAPLPRNKLFQNKLFWECAELIPDFDEKLYWKYFKIECLKFVKFWEGKSYGHEMYLELMEVLENERL